MRQATPSGLFQLYPLVPVALCLVLGIAVGGGVSSGEGLYALVASASASLVLCLLFGRHPRLQTCSILLTSFLAGCALIALAERGYRTSLPGGKVTYEAVVASEPVERAKTIRFDMIITSGPLCGRTVRASLLKDTTDRRYQRIGVNSGIRVCSVLKLPENFKASNFNYVTYLKTQGVSAQTFVRPSDWHERRVSLRGLSVVQRSRLAFLSYRHRLVGRFREWDSDGQGMAVAAAMTLGHKADLSAETRDAYMASGVAHVLALSGMHLGVIYMLLSFLFRGRRFPLLRESLLVSAVWTYVFLVGMPPSAVRSALMLSVYSFVGLTGRDRMSLNVLAFSALLMLVANPFCLYDIGFQQSYISVASILVVNGSLNHAVYSVSRRGGMVARWLFGLIVMSCSAQLATAPLVVYYFGRLPLLFLLANIVAIPLVTIILYLSVASLLLFFIPALQHYAVLSLSCITTFLNKYLAWVASLPGATVTDIHITPVQTVSLYVIIISLFLICRILIHKRVRWRYFY